MTEIIITSIVGILQIILSIKFIVRQKNGVAIFSEIVSSLILLYYLNGFSIKINNESWMWIGLAVSEYLCVKIFLVIFMIIARYCSFYTIRFLCRKKTRKLKLLYAIYRAKYWPKLKLGLPEKANKVHPITNVKFDSKGFPKFKPYYTVKLKEKYHRDTRERHFYMANKILSDDLYANRSLKSKFSKLQLKKIADGQTPTGFTWHHHQDAGVLQLVDEEIHAKTYHIGGYTIWGSK